MKVGDILRIRDDQVIPADCVILTSHSALPERQAVKLKPGSQPIGDIMISTALLDGQADLKQKLAVREVDQAFKVEEKTAQIKLTKLRGLKVYAEAPSPDMEQFRGNVSVLGSGVHKDLNAKNFLPKGSFMVNSTRVEAMVVFTGENSKM